MGQLLHQVASLQLIFCLKPSEKIGCCSGYYCLCVSLAGLCLLYLGNLTVDLFLECHMPVLTLCFILQHCVVLDIEGTTTPISFVTDVMFPYARDNVRKHLTSTYDSEETKEDIKLLRIQVSYGKGI